MRTFIVGILGIAVGSSFSMLLTSTNVGDAPAPCVCNCKCEESKPMFAAQAQPQTMAPPAQSATPPPQADSSESYIDNFASRVMSSAAAATAASSSFTQHAPEMLSQMFHQGSNGQSNNGEGCFIPPPHIDIEQAEAALTRYTNEKWGKPKTGRELLLCYNNNNQKLVDEEGHVSHMWDPTEFHKAGGDGQQALYRQKQEECVNSNIPVNFKSTVVDKFKKVSVNGKVLTFDDIVYGYERIFQSLELFSSVSWLGVSMQQTPNDAFVIADMMWRLKPDLIIELGTSGGGSAHFFAHIMQQYNPQARVLTMDPALPGAGAQGGPLIPWNSASVKRFCPHCSKSNETALWKKGTIRFLHMFPTSPEAIGIAEEMSKVAKRVMVIEDSTHEREVVLSNIKAYGRFVTPGSYLLVQDTRAGRWKPTDAVEDFLNMPEGFEFSRDPRWEYMIFSQHNGGFLRKSGKASA